MHSQISRADAVPGDLRVQAFRDLCESYDPLLRPGATHTGEARDALGAFANLLDLRPEPNATAGDLWRQVRPLLAQQLEPEEAASSGATKVFLPASSTTGEPGLAPPAPPLALLLVEDDPDLSAAMLEALSEAGHLVVAAVSSAEEAATVAAHHAIDFAIVDVELEGADDGVELARTLHSRWGLKSLFISGRPNDRLIDLDVALGFVGKPFAAAELLAAVTLASGLISRRAA